MDPANGRWLNRDPLGYAGGINLYAYCGNDPINGIDPLGLCNPGMAGSWGDYLTDRLDIGIDGLLSGISGGALGGNQVNRRVGK